MPRPIYNSDDGIDCVVMQKFHWVNLVKRILITNGIQKPDLSLKLDIAISYLWGTASIGYSKVSNEYNDETVWVEKIGELRLDTHTYHIGKSPFTAW